MIMIPSMRVDNSKKYLPSKELSDRMSSMRMNRNPREIGHASELMAMEILSGGEIHYDIEKWPLRCESFESFSRCMNLSLTPEFGIRSDDVITVARAGRKDLVFVTESKGTTLQRGFSHSAEAKIFYQLPRTIHKLEGELQTNTKIRLGGAISVESNHYSCKVTVNLLSSSSSLAKDTFFARWL